MADLKVFSAGVAMRIARKAVEAFVQEFLSNDITALGFTPVQKAVGNWSL